jgi:hypothetical protein
LSKRWDMKKRAYERKEKGSKRKRVSPRKMTKGV